MKSKIRILHIDDSLLDRQLVKDTLLKEHNVFELVEADNKEDFEQLLAEKDFDVILSDFNILGFDGLQVLQIVKEKQPDTPVIIVTGTGSEEVAIQSMKMGASDYVIKSVKHIRGLGPTIEMVLKNKRIEDERKSAQLALLESEEKYRKIFENVQDVFYQVDEKGIILDISPSVYRLATYTREEAIGKSISLFYFDLSEHNILLKKIQEKGEVWDYEVRLVTKSGKVKYASLNAHRLFNKNNEPIGIEGSMRDITDRKQIENDLKDALIKAEESDRLKTAFLHNISHEIRTPMNAIIGFSGFLSNPNLPFEKCRKFSKIIIQSSYQLLTIINDIVNIAAIESNQVSLKEDEINLDDTLKQIHEEISEKNENSEVQLILDPTPFVAAEVFITDESKLKQIITNIVLNGLKFTSKGIVNYGYRISDNEIEFFVKDTGIGIPEEMQEIIFERFHQVEKTTAREFGGSGLGLAISKAYVELMGGKIWVNSTLGEGSIFYFTIPHKKAENNLLAEKQIPTNLPVDKPPLKTILIAEDEDSNFVLLEQFLGHLNVNVLRANNGLEAVEICKSNQGDIDLVLMDIKMPVLDGYEATKQIKSILPELKIIAQTAYSDEDDTDKALMSGCNDFISKPIDSKTLISKIINLIY